jgi:hypothetical protein
MIHLLDEFHSPLSSPKAQRHHVRRVSIPNNVKSRPKRSAPDVKCVSWCKPAQPEEVWLLSVLCGFLALGNGQRMTRWCLVGHFKASLLRTSSSPKSMHSSSMRDRDFSVLSRSFFRFSVSKAVDTQPDECVRRDERSFKRLNLTSDRFVIDDEDGECRYSHSAKAVSSPGKLTNEWKRKNSLDKVPYCIAQFAQTR